MTNLTTTEKTALYTSMAKCSTCGDTTSSCWWCGIENPCKYGTVISNVNVWKYLKIKDLWTVDCKKSIELSWRQIFSPDSTISVTPDPINWIWNISKPCCPDKDEKVKIDANDCAWYLGEKLWSCSDRITITPKPKPWLAWCFYLDICFNDSKIPKLDGKIKVKPWCDFAYISDALTWDNETTTVNRTWCKWIVKAKRSINPSIRITLSSPSEFYRTSEVNDTWSVPNTWWQLVNTDNDKWFYWVDLDIQMLNTDTTSTYFTLAQHQVSRLPSTPPIKCIQILKDWVYAFTGSAQNRISNWVSSYRTFIAKDFAWANSMNSLIDDCKTDPSKPRTSINQSTVFDSNLDTIAPNTHKFWWAEQYCVAGEYIFLWGRLSTDVASWPWVGNKWWLQVDYQWFWLSASNVVWSWPWPVTRLQVQYVSDLNGELDNEI